MERLEYQRRVNRAEITPHYGTDFLHIGMPLVKLNDILWNYYSVYGEQQNSGFYEFYNITLKHSIRVSINIIKQVVFRIEFFGNYMGTYKGIGIGSTIQDLLEIRSDIYFDEEFVLVAKYPYDFVIQIDNDNKTIQSLDEVLFNKIVSIEVEDVSLVR